MDGPGEYLKRERELRGVSVEEISDYTKVSVRLIRAFEADEHEKLPQPIFIRGFIKTYCRYLGLDDNDALLRYELFLKEHPEIGGALQQEAPAASTRQPSAPVVFVLLAFVGLLVVITFFLISRWSGEQETPAVEKVAVKEIPGPATVEIPPEKVSVEEKVPAAEEGAVKAGAEQADTEKKAPLEQPKGHELNVLAVERTWIRYIIDDSEPAEVLLRPGEKVRWKARKGFFLRIGNAGGVYLTFDGEQLGLPGKSGEVVELMLPEEEGAKEGQKVEAATDEGSTGPGQEAPLGDKALRTPEAPDTP